MEKIDFTKKDPGPPPPATTCERCGKEAKPKEIALIGWKQQKYCDPCAVIVAEEQKREQAIQERKEKIANLLNASGMIGIMHEMTFSSFNPERRGKIYEVAKQYADDFTPQTNTGLIFFGKVGTGKTHLAVAIARQVIEQKQIGARVARTIELLADIRRTFSEHDGYRAENEADLIQKLAYVPLLVLDDLGAEKISDWVKEVFYRIIDRRWLEQKPVIVTTNLELKELEEKLGERILSRLAGMCVPIAMQNNDFRIENAPRLKNESST